MYATGDNYWAFLSEVWHSEFNIQPTAFLEKREGTGF